MLTFLSHKGLRISRNQMFDNSTELFKVAFFLLEISTLPGQSSMYIKNLSLKTSNFIVTCASTLLILVFLKCHITTTVVIS